jgi:hypothetical protein
MSLKRVGDWKKAQNIIGALSHEMVEARNILLKRFGLYAEGQAKKHMSAQDLGWKPLKAETIKRKIRRGESENILIATSDYFQAITSWQDESKGEVYIGVTKEKKNSEGEVIADIAAIHEFGLGGMPKRELWHPVFKESKVWVNKKENRPEEIFMKLIKSKYGI